MCETISFVVNPIAGGNDKADTISSIREWAQQNKVKLQLYETTGNNDPQEIQKMLATHEPGKVVSVGGDGTLSTCALLLRGTGIPFRYHSAGLG
ncbi:MAG: diacylglycerol kinase family protein [Owenweeksia sp.]|nr:diacylglycerol kinase family protein [Owenweeksia sp.]